MTKSNSEKQGRYTAAKKAQGLKRLVLWAQPEDVESLRLAAHQPHALNRLRKKVERELRPKIEAEVAAELERKTRRAMLAQKRAQVRRQTAGSNRPPELIRFERRPTALKTAPTRSKRTLAVDLGPMVRVCGLECVQIAHQSYFKSR